MANSVPDRAGAPKRQPVVWDVHNTESGEYMHSFRGGSTVRMNNRHLVDGQEVRRGDFNDAHYGWEAPKKRKFQ